MSDPEPAFPDCPFKGEWLVERVETQRGLINRFLCQIPAQGIHVYHRCYVDPLHPRMCRCQCAGAASAFQNVGKESYFFSTHVPTAAPTKEFTIEPTPSPTASPTKHDDAGAPNNLGNGTRGWDVFDDGIWNA